MSTVERLLNILRWTYKFNFTVLSTDIINKYFPQLLSYYEANVLFFLYWNCNKFNTQIS
jgi:mannosyltransferase OCH1-like enzyme